MGCSKGWSLPGEACAGQEGPRSRDSLQMWLGSGGRVAQCDLLARHLAGCPPAVSEERKSKPAPMEMPCGCQRCQLVDRQVGCPASSRGTRRFASTLERRRSACCPAACARRRLQFAVPLQKSDTRVRDSRLRLLAGELVRHAHAFDLLESEVARKSRPLRAGKWPLF